MTTEAQELIKEYEKKANESKNSYEKQHYFDKIRLLEEGYCPTCEVKLPLNHKLK